MPPAGSSLLPVVPIDVALFPAEGDRPGAWKVLHSDGTVLFETTEEDTARGRLATLRQLAQTRMAAGHKVSGSDMATMFPPTAPAPLLLTTLSSESLMREDVFDSPSQTWRMSNVQVFRSGAALKLVGKEGKILTFVPDDVHAFVEAFDALGWQPPLKIGHGIEQPIVLEQLKSIGRVTALRAAKVKGLNGLDELGLFADLDKVPEALHDAIRDGRLYQRSIEFWTDYVPKPDGSGLFHRTLKAIALLGAELPAVGGMPPLDVAPARFSTEGPSETALTQETEDPMPDPAAKAVVQLSAEEYEKLKQTGESAKSEAARLTAENTDLQKRVVRLEIDRRTEGATGAAARLRDAGKITPAQEPFVLELLKSLDDDKKDAVVVTLSTEKGTVESKHSQRGALLSLIDSFPKHPNAPGAPGTKGPHAPTTLAAGFEALNAEKQSEAVATLGEKYAVEAKAATPAARLSAYERAQKDLVDGKVDVATVVS